MKTSLTIIPMCPRECFSHIRVCPGFPLLQKGLGHLVAPYLLSLLVTCYSLQITLSQNYLTEIRLSFPSAPRWVRHSYLLKGLDGSPILVGHQAAPPPPLTEHARQRRGSRK